MFRSQIRNLRGAEACLQLAPVRAWDEVIRHVNKCCGWESESWKHMTKSKGSRRASVCPGMLVALPPGAGSVIGEYEDALGSVESSAAKPR
jgi:hypothetical protein